METTLAQPATVPPQKMGGSELDALEASFGAAPKGQPVVQEQADAPVAEAKPSTIHEKEEAPLTGKDQKEVLEEEAAEEASNMSAEEKALLGIEEQAPASWSDEEKAKFKAHFGHEDPDGFKNEYAKLREEHATYSKENEGLKATTDRLAKLDPHVARALELEMEEKGAGQKYLRSLPDVDLLAKDARKIGDKQLLDTYVKDHGITEEQWAVLGDENADPGEVDALKRRISYLRANGEDLHKKAQGALAQDREADQARQREFNTKYNEAVAAAIAKVKDGPMKAFVTAAHEDEIRSGKFVGRFVQEDGISPKPELLELILKAEKYDTLKKLAEKNYNKGKGDGTHEAMNRLPPTPRQGRTAPATSTKPKQPLAEQLDEFEQGIR